MTVVILRYCYNTLSFLISCGIIFRSKSNLHNSSFLIVNSISRWCQRMGRALLGQESHDSWPHQQLTWWQLTKTADGLIPYNTQPHHTTCHSLYIRHHTMRKHYNNNFYLLWANVKKCEKVWWAELTKWDFQSLLLFIPPQKKNSLNFFHILSRKKERITTTKNHDSRQFCLTHSNFLIFLCFLEFFFWTKKHFFQASLFRLLL